MGNISTCQASRAWETTQLARENAQRAGLANARHEYAEEFEAAMGGGAKPTAKFARSRAEAFAVMLLFAVLAAVLAWGFRERLSGQSRYCAAVVFRQLL